MSERELSQSEVASLRCDIAAAQRQLECAFEVMDFDPDEEVEGVEQMRLAAVAFHLRCARSLLEPATKGAIPA